MNARIQACYREGMPHRPAAAPIAVRNARVNIPHSVYKHTYEKYNISKPSHIASEINQS